MTKSISKCQITKTQEKQQFFIEPKPWTNLEMAYMDLRNASHMESSITGVRFYKSKYESGKKNWSHWGHVKWTLYPFATVWSSPNKLQT